MWFWLAVAIALLAVGAQLLAMAQLAQHQVQRGAQLRQTLAAERGATGTAATTAPALSAAGARVQTVSAAQRTLDELPAHVLR